MHGAQYTLVYVVVTLMATVPGDATFWYDNAHPGNNLGTYNVPRQHHSGNRRGFAYDSGGSAVEHPPPAVHVKTFDEMKNLANAYVIDDVLASPLSTDKLPSDLYLQGYQQQGAARLPRYLSGLIGTAPEDEYFSGINSFQGGAYHGYASGPGDTFTQPYQEITDNGRFGTFKDVLPNANTLHSNGYASIDGGRTAHQQNNGLGLYSNVDSMDEFGARTYDEESGLPSIVDLQYLIHNPYDISDNTVTASSPVFTPTVARPVQNEMPYVDRGAAQYRPQAYNPFITPLRLPPVTDAALIRQAMGKDLLVNPGTVPAYQSPQAPQASVAPVFYLINIFAATPKPATEKYQPQAKASDMPKPLRKFLLSSQYDTKPIVAKPSAKSQSSTKRAPLLSPVRSHRLQSSPNQKPGVSIQLRQPPYNVWKKYDSITSRSAKPNSGPPVRNVHPTQRAAQSGKSSVKVNDNLRSLLDNVYWRSVSRVTDHILRDVKGPPTSITGRQNIPRRTYRAAPVREQASRTSRRASVRRGTRD